FYDFVECRYGDLLITPREASYFADYAVRCFDVEPVNERFNRMSPGARSDVGSIDSNPGSEYANVPSVRHLNGHAETSFVGSGNEGKVDIFDYVSALRKQRNLMVQSQEQYVFIYKALAEWHLFGHTDMDVEQLIEHYQTLIDPGMRDRASSFSGITKLVVRSDAAPATGMEAEFR
ncbi:hypothetical protein TELCIR_23292, partial [Teladorsagia circumcincta]